MIRAPFSMAKGRRQMREEKAVEKRKKISHLSNPKSAFRAKGFHYERQLSLRMLQHIRRVSWFVWPAQSSRGFFSDALTYPCPAYPSNKFRRYP